jgi:hypothetical protein
VRGKSIGATGRWVAGDPAVSERLEAVNEEIDLPDQEPQAPSPPKASSQNPFEPSGIRHRSDNMERITVCFAAAKENTVICYLLYVICHRLRLFASKTDSFDEKSLKKEKRCHHWQHRQTGSRHQQVELNSMHRFEKGQAQRQRIWFVVLQIDQRA